MLHMRESYIHSSTSIKFALMHQMVCHSLCVSLKNSRKVTSHCKRNSRDCFRPRYAEHGVITNNINVCQIIAASDSSFRSKTHTIRVSGTL